MKPKITVHSFSNGTAILVFDGDVRPEQLDEFRKMWLDAWAKAKQDSLRPIFQIGGTDVDVVTHANPLGEEIGFDAVSHAFGALGMYVEDEQIEAFIEGLRSFYGGES